MTIQSSDVRFKAFIHTVQISTPYQILDDDAALTKPFISKKKKPYIRNNKVNYVVNPNKLGKPCSSLAECVAAIYKIIDELLLTDYEWSIERIDVTLDTDTPYDELYKPMCYMKELYALYIGNSSNAYRVIGDDMKKRSTIVRSSRQTLEIYNKRIESGDRNVPETRFEFRYSRVWECKSRRSIEASFLWAIDSSIKAFDNFLRLMPSLDSLKADVLLKAYLAENDTRCEGRTIGINEFVTKYADFIYTRNNLQTLYYSIRQGNFTKWLYNFRKKGQVITLINKTYLEGLCSKMQSALNHFRNYPESWDN